MSLTYCPHGAPKPPPEPAAAPPAARAPRTTRTTVPAGAGTTRRAAARVPGAPAAPAAPVRRAPRTAPGRTPQSAFRPYVLAILGDHAGRLERELVMDELAVRMARVLQRDDLAVGPSGEVRWRTVVTKERRALGDDGLVTSGGPGLWELTPAGYAALEAIRAAVAASEAAAVEQPASE